MAYLDLHRLRELAADHVEAGTMFRTVYQVPVETALTYGLITTSGAIVAGTLTCSLLIDMVGRRRWFILAFSVAAAAMLAVWVVGALSRCFWSWRWRRSRCSLCRR